MLFRSDYILIDNAFNEQPPPPVVATPISTSEIDLSWTSQPDAVEYQIYRSTDPYFTEDISNLFDDVTTNSDVDNQVTPGTKYYYIVDAINSDNSTGVVGHGSATTPIIDGSGTGSPASIDGGIVPAVASVDPPPSGLVATGINDLEIFLTWTSNAPHGSEINIQISTDPLDPDLWTDVASVPVSVTTYTVRRDGPITAPFLQEDVDYFFRVQSSSVDDLDSMGNPIFATSDWSNTAEGTVVVPSIPDTIIIIGGHTQTESHLEQSWFAPAGQGFSVGIEWKDLINDGYNVFMSSEADWQGSVVQANGRGPLYDELNEEIARGWAQNIALIGYSHGGGIIYNMSQDIHQDEQLGQTQQVVYVGTIDAVERETGDDTLPTPLPASPGNVWGAMDTNYYETNGTPIPGTSYLFPTWAVDCHGVSMANTTNTQITVIQGEGIDANHVNIYTDPRVISGIENSAIFALSQAGGGLVRIATGAVPLDAIAGDALAYTATDAMEQDLNTDSDWELKLSGLSDKPPRYAI